jgi:hypothetical protein
VTNPATGASVALRKYPPSIEGIFRVGGLPQLGYQRYMREQAGK